MVDILPRYVASALREYLHVFPVVAITGARQTGKSTLAMSCAGERPRRHVTLDDRAQLERALSDPEAFVAGDDPITIDEVQRAPELLIAIKREVDRHKTPGRFLLTGSAHLLQHAKVAESLAGRAGFVTLWPMTRRELLGQGRTGLWQELWDAPDTSWRDVLSAAEPQPADWREAARRGGMPDPALHLPTPEARALWHQGYLDSYLERDLRDLSAVASLTDFRRLMQAAALRVGCLQNQTEMARDIGMPLATAHRYLSLLEVSYQLCRVPAFTRNRTSRLMKSPKLYWPDTATALHVASEPEPRGVHLENLVVQDLTVWASRQIPRAEIMHWRTTSGREVDFVVEMRHQVLPIEVKSALKVGPRDAAGLRAFRDEYGDSSRYGLLLYGGHEIFWLARDILAAPWWAVL